MRAFWLLVLAPLALAGYLAVRVSSDGAELRQHQLQGLLDGRLGDVRSRASQSIAKLERQLSDELVAAPTSPEDLRELARRIPLARQVFRVDREGGLAFPVRRDASREELDFLERTESIWAGRAILRGGATRDTTIAAKGAPGVGDSLVDFAGIAEHGWQTWYWAEGLHLLFWRRAPDGGVIGVEVERIGLLARIVGALPTTGLEEGRIELADSRGDTVTQWGPLLPVEGVTAPSDAAIALEAPLDSWQLRYFMAPAQRDALVAGPGLALFLGLGAGALALLGLAVYIYREYTRRLRDAARRVGFVTRVSHELRTPLTNIRMYAELLEDGADADDDDQARRARVIVSESERLGRLIDNVLAFARHQRGKLAARLDCVDIDVAVREAVKKLEPVLGARSIDVRFELAAQGRRVAGADAIDQIVTNLMSNVEKYAPGGEVVIASHAVNGHVVIAVTDTGPGVPVGERAAIFEPFHRAGDSLTDANGTGIGLAIARELARAAGGELALAESARGARFELTLPVAKDDP